MQNDSDPSAAPLYYQSSNRISPAVFAWLAVVGGSGAITLGFAYAFITFLVHVLGGGPGLILVTPFFAAALMVLGRRVCRLGQVRMRSARLPIVLGVAAIGFYASWHAYLNFARQDTPGIFNPLPTWHMSPPRLVRAMCDLASDRGWGSWLLWSLEAATIFCTVYLLMQDDDPEVPFCEQCHSWTKEVFHVELNDHATASAVEAFKRGSVEALHNLGPRNRSASHYLQVRVLACGCGASRYACVEAVTVEPGKSGGMRFGSITPGGRAKLHYNFGSSSSSKATPIITNIVIDEATQDKLSILQSELRKGK